MTDTLTATCVCGHARKFHHGPTIGCAPVEAGDGFARATHCGCLDYREPGLSPAPQPERLLAPTPPASNRAATGQTAGRCHGREGLERIPAQPVFLGIVDAPDALFIISQVARGVDEQPDFAPVLAHLRLMLALADKAAAVGADITAHRALGVDEAAEIVGASIDSEIEGARRISAALLAGDPRP